MAKRSTPKLTAADRDALRLYSQLPARARKTLRAIILEVARVSGKPLKR